MAKTLLECVNEVLKRVRIIAGDAGELTSLTDSSRQPAVDVAVQVINEGIDGLYTAAETPHPNEQAESSFTLIDGTQSYTLASDLLQLRWPIIDKTNTQFLYETDYNTILAIDPEQDDTGLAHTAAISPVDGTLYLDRTPTSVEAGAVYTYQYDKDVSMAVLTDTVPFNDAVFRAMVPPWAQLWSRDFRHQFDADLFAVNLGRAAKL